MVCCALQAIYTRSRHLSCYNRSFSPFKVYLSREHFSSVMTTLPSFFTIILLILFLAYLAEALPQGIAGNRTPQTLHLPLTQTLSVVSKAIATVMALAFAFPFTSNGSRLALPTVSSLKKLSTYAVLIMELHSPVLQV